MERRVKERLVGAAVLMAAAIILIPEMLSGPEHKDATASAAATQSDGPYKTYTIDLNRSPGAPTTAPVSEQAPPPEETPPEVVTPAAASPVADSGSPSELSASDTQASPESASPRPASQPPERVVSVPPPERVASAPPPASSALPQAQQQAQPRAREQVSAPAVVSTPAVPTSKGWAVQLGSFSSRATAERMVKDLSGSGLNAFVMPVKSGANTLYRVRVGPYAERAAANDALTGIKKRVANAAVVAHP